MTVNEIKNPEELKNLLINQIETELGGEKVINMIENDVNHFIEIDLGKFCQVW